MTIQARIPNCRDGPGWWRRGILGALGLLLVASGVSAQEVASSLEALRTSGRVRSGDTIYVTDAAGTTTKGTVADITADAVTLDAGMLGDSRRAVPASSIERIERADALTNGVLIGSAAGAAAAALMPAMLCDLPDSECAWRAFLFAGVPAAVGAVVAGALIDRAIRPTVFRRAGGSVRLDVLPLLGPTRSGVALSLRF